MSERSGHLFGWRTRAIVALAITLAVAATYVSQGDAPVFERIEGQSLDWRFQLRGPIEPGPETVLLVIDDRSLAALGQWPLSRAELARAVEHLAADEAAVIAFDLLFLGAEDRGAKAAVRSQVSRYGIPSQMQAADTETEASEVEPVGPVDRTLIEAIWRAGNTIVPFAFAFAPNEANVTGLPAAVEAFAYRVQRLPAEGAPKLRLQPLGLVAPPMPLLAAGTAAHVNVVLENDGSLRFADPVIAYRGFYFPSLPIEAVRLYRGVGPAETELLFGDGIRIGESFIPTDHQMRFPVNYYGPAGTFAVYSIIELLEGRLPPGTFTGRIVLIGTTALGVGDTFPTPFSRRLPGIEYFATAIDNLVQGNYLIRSDMTFGLDVLAIVVSGLLAAALSAIRIPALAVLGTTALFAGWCAIAYLSFLRAGMWLNFTFAAGAIVLNVGFVAVTRTLGEYRLRLRAERQEKALSRYVSPLVTEGLAAGGDSLVGETTQLAVVMFVDMRGSTKLSEGLSPAESMALLRDFHRRVERAVMAHQGIVDKFMGDGAIILFGVPRPDPSDPRRALACARQLTQDVADWSRELTGQGKSPVTIGVGLHFGPVAVGEMGGEQRPQLTVGGDTVNVGSRLESLTVTHDVTIIASDALVQAARETGAESELEGFAELPLQEIRGREQPLKIWSWRADLRETPPARGPLRGSA